MLVDTLVFMPPVQAGCSYYNDKDFCKKYNAHMIHNYMLALLSSEYAYPLDKFSKSFIVELLNLAVTAFKV